ncbi:MAG: glycosyltransferase family 8 protein [Rickettsiales bacterium]|nr:glycosyltransferase family 8 protein [Rickettsiales bacterium]
MNAPTPAFKGNNTAIVFASDNNFAPYLAVSIQSVINSSNKEKKYEIIVLESGIKTKNKDKIKSMLPDNFAVHFVSMDHYISAYNMHTFFHERHLNYSAYFRLFIPEILQNYSRAVYLDSDLIVCEDIANLANINLCGKHIGAIPDIIVQQTKPTKYVDYPMQHSYLKKHLGIKDVFGYFNSGVLVMDLDKMRTEKRLIPDLIKMAKHNNKYYHDQNVLNAVMQEKVEYLPVEWNFMLSAVVDDNMNISSAPPNLYTSVQKLIKDGGYKIIHYCGYDKPWNFPNSPYANIWWKTAKKTPFYRHLVKYPKWLGLLLSGFIPNRKNRHHFRKLHIKGDIS